MPLPIDRAFDLSCFAKSTLCDAIYPSGYQEMARIVKFWARSNH
jgi:hypothetical protein